MPGPRSLRRSRVARCPPGWAPHRKTSRRPCRAPGAGTPEGAPQERPPTAPGSRRPGCRGEKPGPSWHPPKGGASGLGIRPPTARRPRPGPVQPRWPPLAPAEPVAGQVQLERGQAQGGRTGEGSGRRSEHDLRRQRRDPAGRPAQATPKQARATSHMRAAQASRQPLPIRRGRAATTSRAQPHTPPPKGPVWNRIISPKPRRADGPDEGPSTTALRPITDPDHGSSNTDRPRSPPRPLRASARQTRPGRPEPTRPGGPTRR